MFIEEALVGSAAQRVAPHPPLRPLWPWFVAVGLGVPGVGAAATNELPQKPLPGQCRTDATGRCPHRSETPINGGCWKKLAVDAKDCPDGDFVYQGACYTPAFPPQRPAVAILAG